MVLLTYLTRAPDPEKVAPFVWKPWKAKVTDEQGRAYPWYQRVGTWTIVAGIMTLMIYIVLW
jgi:hypothetical protein